MPFKWLCCWILVCLLLGMSARAATLEYWSLEAPNQAPSRFVGLAPGPQGQGLQLNAGMVGQVLIQQPDELFYELYHQGQADWMRADLKTGRSHLLLKDKGLHPSAFNRIYPQRQPDGSYFAVAIFPYRQEVFRLRPGKAPMRVLSRPDLHGFEPLPQGGYLFVTWDPRGDESAHYADFIPGRKMQLWHQPLKGTARRLGAFDTVLDLRVSDGGKQALFFSPGHPHPDRWKLIRMPLNGSPAQLVAEIPKPIQWRGTPHLASWPHLNWIVYPSQISPDIVSIAPQRLMRQQLGQPAQFWFEERLDVFEKGFSPQGYLSRLSPEPADVANPDLRWLECMDVRSGQSRARFEINWRNPGWMTGFCLER